MATSVPTTPTQTPLSAEEMVNFMAARDAGRYVSAVALVAILSILCCEIISLVERRRHLLIAKPRTNLITAIALLGQSCLGVWVSVEGLELWWRDWSTQPEACDSFVKPAVAAYVISKQFTYLFLFVRLKTVHDAIKLNSRIFVVARWLLVVIILLVFPAVFYTVAAVFFYGTVLSDVCFVLSLSLVPIIVFMVGDFGLSVLLLFLFIAPLYKMAKGSGSEVNKPLLRVARENLFASMVLIVVTNTAFVFITYTHVQLEITLPQEQDGNTRSVPRLRNIHTIHTVLMIVDDFVSVIMCHFISRAWIPSFLPKILKIAEPPEEAGGTVLFDLKSVDPSSALREAYLPVSDADIFLANSPLVPRLFAMIRHAELPLKIHFVIPVTIAVFSVTVIGAAQHIPSWTGLIIFVVWCLPFTLLVMLCLLSKRILARLLKTSYFISHFIACAVWLSSWLDVVQYDLRCCLVTQGFLFLQMTAIGDALVYSGSFLRKVISLATAVQMLGMWITLQFGLIEIYSNTVITFDFGFGAQQYSVAQNARDLSLILVISSITDFLFAIKRRHRFLYLDGRIDFRVLNDLEQVLSIRVVAGEDNKETPAPTATKERANEAEGDESRLSFKLMRDRTQRMRVGPSGFIEEVASQYGQGASSPLKERMDQGPIEEESRMSPRRICDKNYAKMVRLRKSDMLAVHCTEPGSRRRVWLVSTLDSGLYLWVLRLALTMPILTTSLLIVRPVGYRMTIVALCTFQTLVILSKFFHLSYKMVALYLQRLVFWSNALALFVYFLLMSFVLSWDVRCLVPFTLFLSGLLFSMLDCATATPSNGDGRDDKTTKFVNLSKANAEAVYVLLIAFSSFALLPMAVFINAIPADTVLIDFRPDLVVQGAVNSNDVHVLDLKQFACDLGPHSRWGRRFLWR